MLVFILHCPLLSQRHAVFLCVIIYLVKYIICGHGIRIVFIAFRHIYDIHGYPHSQRSIRLALVGFVKHDAVIFNIIFTGFRKMGLLHIQANGNCPQILCNLCCHAGLRRPSHGSYDCNGILPYEFGRSVYEFVACKHLGAYGLGFSVHKILRRIVSSVGAACRHPYNILNSAFSFLLFCNLLNNISDFHNLYLLA